jgi:ABC-type branched-subunit amino acid transport system substrate-binding protein
MSDFGMGPFPSAASTAPQALVAEPAILPLAAGETFGAGPVRVALLLPLSGDPGLTSVGTSMANAGELAMSFIEANPNIAENITVVLKDTGPTAGGAAEAASQAVAEGASLILGPLKADQVVAAGAVARSAGVPLIGFSNTANAAAPGVYLLNILPEVEIRRSLLYASSKGRVLAAGIFSTSDAGRAHEVAFRRAATELGVTIAAVHTFSTESDIRNAVLQLAPLIQAGQIDTLFLPDRLSAPSVATLLLQASIEQGRLLIIGSADWEADPTIPQVPYLTGAVFPAVDEAGYLAMKPDYQARFGGLPHPLATIAYTAVILANNSTLSKATPRYSAAQVTLSAGFNGRDGVFRFLPDGRSEYALVMKQVTPGGSLRVDGPRM